MIDLLNSKFVNLEELLIVFNAIYVNTNKIKCFQMKGTNSLQYGDKLTVYQFDSQKGVFL